MTQIRFVIERFFYGWGMNGFVFDPAGKRIEFFVGNEESVKYDDKGVDTDTFHLKDNPLYQQAREKALAASIPVIHMDEDGIYYLAFCDAQKNFFLFGPAAIDTLSFRQQMSFKKKQNIKDPNYLVPIVPLGKALNGILLVFYTLTGLQVSEKDIMKASNVQQGKVETSLKVSVYETRNSSEQKEHLAYQDELKWLAQIENGTMPSMESRMTPENIAKLEKIGILSTDDSLKQFEYMFVGSTVLASRAAIRGGMNAYDAYSMSEIFLQQISKATSIMELLHIYSEVVEEFSKQVRLAKENRTYDCVEQCKDYIARHRTKKFSLEEVAEYVGKNPSYVSRVFSEQTGMTMQDYALGVRLEAAANLLCHSNETIGEIAEYLNFPSQSYFGERFKKKYGVTPAAYRKEHKIRDFKE